MLVLVLALLNTLLAASLPHFTVTCPEDLDKGIGESFVHHLASCGVFEDDGPDVLDTLIKHAFDVDGHQTNLLTTSKMVSKDGCRNIRHSAHFMLIKGDITLGLQLSIHFQHQEDLETEEPDSPWDVFPAKYHYRPVAIKVTLTKIQRHTYQLPEEITGWVNLEAQRK